MSHDDTVCIKDYIVFKGLTDLSLHLLHNICSCCCAAASRTITSGDDELLPHSYRIDWHFSVEGTLRVNEDCDSLCFAPEDLSRSRGRRQTDGRTEIKWRVCRGDMSMSPRQIVILTTFFISFISRTFISCHAVCKTQCYCLWERMDGGDDVKDISSRQVHATPPKRVLVSLIMHSVHSCVPLHPLLS